MPLANPSLSWELVFSFLFNASDLVEPLAPPTFSTFFLNRLRKRLINDENGILSEYSLHP